MASFASMTIYQLGVLVPISLLTQVNLNFSLCHSPADPFHQFVGYHYFSGAVFALNFFSLIGRWVLYIMILPLQMYFRTGKEQKINEQRRENVKR